MTATLNYATVPMHFCRFQFISRRHETKIALVFDSFKTRLFLRKRRQVDLLIKTICKNFLKYQISLLTLSELNWSKQTWLYFATAIFFDLILKWREILDHTHTCNVSRLRAYVQRENEVIAIRDGEGRKRKSSIIPKTSDILGS